MPSSNLSHNISTVVLVIEMKLTMKFTASKILTAATIFNIIKKIFFSIIYSKIIGEGDKYHLTVEFLSVHNCYIFYGK